MARPTDTNTRVDQLHAVITRVARHHHKRAGAPPAGQFFTVDSEGVVRDQTGRKVYEPPTEST